MTQYLLWFTVILYVSATLLTVGIALLVSLSPAFQAGRVKAVSALLGLVVGEGVRDEVRQRVIARFRWSMVGAVTSIVAYFALVVSLPSFWSANALFSLFGIAGAQMFHVGRYFGSAASATLAARKATQPEVTYARARALDLSDFVPAWSRRGSVILAVCVVPVAVASALVLSFADSDSFARQVILPVVITAEALFLVIGWLAFMGARLASRALLQRGQRSDSPEQLAWSDALLSLALGDLIAAPMMAFGAAVMISLAGLVAGTFGTPLGMILIALLLLAIFVLLVRSILNRNAKPQQYYLRRLWPEIAAQGDALRASEGVAT